MAGEAAELRPTEPDFAHPGPTGEVSMIARAAALLLASFCAAAAAVALADAPAAATATGSAAAPASAAAFAVAYASATATPATPAAAAPAPAPAFAVAYAPASASAPAAPPAFARAAPTPAATAAAAGEARDRPPLASVLAAAAGATNYTETAISPDGRWVAWAQSVPVTGRASALGSAIYLAPTAHPGDVRQVTAVANASAATTLIANAGAGTTGNAPGAVRERALAWSPDSHSLAFLSDAEVPGQLQLYVMRIRDRSLRKLTDLRGYLATPGWSHDGKTIAFLFTENALRAAGPLEAVASETGVIGRQILEQRITTLDLETGVVKQISPADLYVYEYDWSPDGSRFAVTAAHGSGDNNWYIAQIYLIDRATGETKSIYQSDLQIAVPRWSSDGSRIAFIGGLNSDESIASGDVYVMPASGGQPQNLTPQSSGSTFWFAWLPKSEKLLLADAIEGGSGLIELNARTRTARTFWQGEETLGGPGDFAFGVSLAADGKTTAVIRQSFNEPPGVWVGTAGAWRALTPLVRTASAPAWGKAVNIHWSSDEFSVQGWLVPPATLQPGRAYPMVVWIHGGPAWLKAPAWAPQIEYATLLASQGYFLFFPNPRGSAGFGERFKRANVKDMGGGDLRDVLAGIRAVVSSYPVDDGRVGITGWSYGGYMTLWAITQTDRFRAAVGGAGCSDLLSYYGENGIDEWLIPYFGASVYDDPAVYAKSSPINFIKQVHTPTLLIVGDSDVESPPPQSFEYWHALKTLGVKTELVIYPHEGHEFSDPAHVLDRIERIVAWFDENMPPASADMQTSASATPTR
jgi:dipeptidyl aminopeptidase/acylaminoacyl peptidase